MALAGTLPALGDTVRTDGLELRVAGLRGRRITRVEVRQAEMGTQSSRDQ